MVDAGQTGLFDPGTAYLLGRSRHAIPRHRSRHGAPRFRCPIEGCHRREEPFKGYTVCDDVVWENPDENVYEVGGKVSRASAEWQNLTTCGGKLSLRYFSLLKDNHWVEDHRCRGLDRVGLQWLRVTLGILMYQAMTLDRMLELVVSQT